MKYYGYKIGNIPDEETSEIVMAELADFGFDSFTEYDEDGKTLDGYIPVAEWEKNREVAERYLADFGFDFACAPVDDTVNWNREWESGFSPIGIGEECRVRAPFHESDARCRYEITVMPKMSFGTGHHPTTYLMLGKILDLDLAGKTGLDMGSGTGILAILAAMKGAKSVDAIDIEEWAYENCIENAEMNGMADKVSAHLGDASLLRDPGKYDFVFANINRNILLADMERYVRAMKPGGIILFSGFLRIDSPVLGEKARSRGLTLVECCDREGWMLEVFVK